MEATSSGRNHFTQQKKQLIVQEHYSTGISIAVLARKYGIQAITLYRWKKQMSHKKDQSEIDPEFIQKLVDENDRLKSENKNLLSKVGDLKSTAIAKEIKTYNRYEVGLIADVLNISRSSIYYEAIYEKNTGKPRYYQKSEDQGVLKEIKAVIAIRATYGYRRITTMVNRLRKLEGRNIINRKYFQRIMQMNVLTLSQTMPAQKIS